MSEFSNQDYQSSPQGTSSWDTPNRPARPNNYLVIAIVGTVLGLCSCLGFIVGIIAIVFAVQVNSKYDVGDYSGAESSANTAKILSFTSLGLAILGLIGNIIYYAVVGAALFSEYNM